MAKKKNPYIDMYTLRADGRYQGYYRDSEGKRHSVCDRDPEKLYQKIQALTEQAEKPLLFGDYAEHWHDANWDSIRDGTKSCYAAPLKRAIDKFGDWEITGIGVPDLNAHLLQLSGQGFSRSTIKHQKIVYSQIFKQAIKEGALVYNPAEHCEIPSDSKRAIKREAPEDETVQQIKSKAETAYFGLFAMFLICTGFRRGEALAVRWEDIDYKNKWIHCKHQVQSRSGRSQLVPTKSESGVRSVPLLPALEAVLVRPEDARDTDFVFSAGEDTSKPMPECTYNRRWMHYCKDMGFVTIKSQEKRISKQGHTYTHTEYAPSLTAHHLRHGYATMLFEAEVDEQTAMVYMGHSNIRITHEVYTHLRQKKQAESSAKLMAYSRQIFEK